MSKLKAFVKRHRKAFTIGGFGLMGIIGFFLGTKYEKRRTLQNSHKSNEGNRFRRQKQQL